MEPARDESDQAKREIAEVVGKTPTPTAVLRQRLAELRKANNAMTAQDLADAVSRYGGDLSRATIAKIEAGRRGVSLDEAFLLAAALNVSPVYLFLPVDDAASVRVTPNLLVPAGRARGWVRGRYPLPQQDSRVYLTQRPDEEWDALSAQQPRRWRSRDGDT